MILRDISNFEFSRRISNISDGIISKWNRNIDWEYEKESERLLQISEQNHYLL